MTPPFSSSFTFSLASLLRRGRLNDFPARRSSSICFERAPSWSTACDLPQKTSTLASSSHFSTSLQWRLHQAGYSAHEVRGYCIQLAGYWHRLSSPSPQLLLPLVFLAFYREKIFYRTEPSSQSSGNLLFSRDQRDVMRGCWQECNISGLLSSLSQSCTGRVVLRSGKISIVTVLTASSTTSLALDPPVVMFGAMRRGSFRPCRESS